MAYLNNKLRSDVLNNFLSPMDYVDIYTAGTAPVDADAATTGTRLVRLYVDYYSAFRWNNASNGTARLFNIVTGTAVADGTANYARIVQESTTRGMQTTSVGMNNTYDIFLDNTIITNGELVSMLQCTMVYPES